MTESSNNAQPQTVALPSPKRRVSWKDSCRVRTYPMVTCDNEREQIWYRSSDYKEFKRERKAAAQLAKAVGMLNLEKTDFVSCRGIEFMIDETNRQKKADLQRLACAAVLTAQLFEFQVADEMGEEANMILSSAIPKSYKKYSSQAHLEASKKAWAWRKSDEAASSDISSCRKEDKNVMMMRKKKTKSTFLSMRSVNGVASTTPKTRNSLESFTKTMPFSVHSALRAG